MSTDEKYVRSVWPNVRPSTEDPFMHGLILSDAVAPHVGVWRLSSMKDAWSAAAEFTRERLEQVRQLRSEADRNSQHVAALHSELDYAVREGLAALARVAAKNICTDSRTLARLEAELTRLTAGMKPEPQQ